MREPESGVGVEIYHILPFQALVSFNFNLSLLFSYCFINWSNNLCAIANNVKFGDN
jgi:hypothetical protein